MTKLSVDALRFAHSAVVAFFSAFVVVVGGGVVVVVVVANGDDGRLQLVCSDVAGGGGAPNAPVSADGSVTLGFFACPAETPLGLFATTGFATSAVVVAISDAISAAAVSGGGVAAPAAPAANVAEAAAPAPNRCRPPLRARASLLAASAAADRARTVLSSRAARCQSAMAPLACRCDAFCDRWAAFGSYTSPVLIRRHVPVVAPGRGSQ